MKIGKLQMKNMQFVCMCAGCIGLCAVSPALFRTVVCSYWELLDNSPILCVFVSYLKPVKCFLSTQCLTRTTLEQKLGCGIKFTNESHRNILF